MTELPTLVYDDDCGFCTWSARYAATHGEFETVGFSELTDEQLARLPTDFETCAHLFADGRVYSCGACAEEVLARLDTPAALPARVFGRLPERVRGPIREPVYRWVADHRAWWGKLRRAEPPA
ncbi:thiol-disulfide oxidoreductase DCC family protein [Haloarchaeobius sp. TZWWS8]|uniref:thiol-disulfide oxidoreductase DCC family protein n=1 Tax=Haloarchaeobius sp. TZWWS8 TaxID=3446121 RepID=UPI003EBADFA3